MISFQIELHSYVYSIDSCPPDQPPDTLTWQLIELRVSLFHYWTSLKLDLWYFMVPEADLLLCPSADYHIINKNCSYFYSNWYNSFSYCSSAELHNVSGLLQYFDIWQLHILLTFEAPNPPVVSEATFDSL